MEAVIKTGGKQFYVQKGDIIEAEITSQDIGAEVTIDDVLLISDSTSVISDPTQLKSAKVKAKILSLVKGKKVIFISDDPASPIDFIHFSENEGYKISIKSTTKGIHYFTMYKIET